MAATTMFYAPIHGLQQLIDTLYILDERLVSIAKVTNNADLSTIFDNATESALRFGQTIDGTLSSLESILKLGYNQQDAQALNNSAMLLSTVGEFKDNAQAAEYLTSIMKQYQMTVSDTTKIVDSLNSVSNQTGADTISLAEGLSKSSAVANMAGVSFDELSGMISSTQETLHITGNEAGTFYKTLFTRLLRDDVQQSLNEIGIATKTTNGEFISATEILKNLGGIYDTLDASTQNFIASQLGGTWHVSKVASLLEHQADVAKNTAFSVDSLNSAENELSTFQEGLRYKTNQMIASFQSLAWTIGENGVTDLLKNLIDLVTSTTRGFTEITEATNGWNIKLPLIAAGVYGVVKALSVLRVAMTGVKMSFGVVGVATVGLELLMSYLNKSSVASDKLTEKNNRLSDSYKEHRSDVKGLVEEYSKYESKIKNGTFGVDYNTEDISKYRDISNELASIMPDLVLGEDQYQNKILGSSERIKAKTEFLEKQLKIQEKIDAYNKQEETTKTYEDTGKQLSYDSKRLDNFWRSSKNKAGANSIEDVDKTIEEYEKKVQGASKYDPIAYINRDILNKAKETRKAYYELESSVDELKLKYQQSIMDMIDTNIKLDSSSSTMVKSLLDDFSTFVATADASEGEINKSLNNLLSSLKTDTGFQNKLKEYSTAVKNFQNAISSGASDKELENYKNKALDAFNVVKTELLDLAKDGGMDKEELSVLSAQLDNLANSAILGSIDFDKLAQSTGKTKEELMQMLGIAPEVQDGIEGIGNAAEGTKQTFEDLVDSISSLNSALEDYYENGQLSSEAMLDLIGQYPELLGYIGDEKAFIQHLEEVRNRDVDAAKQQLMAKLMMNEDFYNNNIDALQQYFDEHFKWYDGDLKQFKTLAEAKADVEKKLIENIAKQWAEYYGTAMYYNKKTQQFAVDNWAVGSKYAKGVEEANQALEEGRNAFDEFTLDKIELDFNAIGTAADDFGEKSKKSYEISTYLANEYEQALAGVNAQIEKQNNLQSIMNKYSQEYRDSIKKEIELLKAKMALMKNQAASLQQQIASGNIQQYGILSNKYTAGGYGGADSGVAGYYLNNFKVTSQYGENRGNENHKGVDLANGREGDLVKAVRGGKVITATYSKTAGNWVVVQQDDGTIAKYMHLQSGLNVSVGQQIQAGQTLGRVGNTGNSTGAHLHLQIESNGTPIDPLAYLRSNGGGSVSPVASGGSNASVIWNFFKSKGFTDSVVAGIMGNLKQESMFDPTMINKSSGASGIAQWLGGRLSGLKSFAGQKGTAWTDINTQLEYLWKELNGSENKTLKYLQNNPNASASQVALEFERLFERSGGSANAKRQSYANEIYNQFKGTMGTAGGGSGSGDYYDSLSEASRLEAERLQNVDQAKLDLLQLGSDIDSLQAQLQSLYMELIESRIAEFDRNKSLYNDDLAKIDLIQAKENETSKEWIDQQKQREGILDKQIDQQKASIQYIKDEIAYNQDISYAQKQLLEDKLVERYSELYQMEQNLLDQRMNMADKIIETYKKALEAQRKATVDSIDKMIEDINKSTEEDEYKKNLGKAQKDRQKILDEIAQLQLDDSASAKKRLKDLNEQLQQSDENIQDMQDDKSKKDRIDNLNTQKEQVEDYYDNLINDERKFNQMRTDIINANATQINADLNSFYANIISNTKLLGKALSENLIDLVNQARMYMEGEDYKPIQVAQAESGGMLPNWSNNNGRLMYVHPNELISTADQTQNLLKSFSLADSLIGKIKDFLPSLSNLPKLPSIVPKLEVASTGNNYSVTIQNMNVTGDKNGIKTFMNDLEAEFKRLGGKLR